jgi:hypothetical protein
MVIYKSGLIWDKSTKDAKYNINFKKDFLSIGGFFYRKNIYYHKITNYSIAKDQNTIREDFSLAKAIIGGAIAGPPGLLVGFFGSQKVDTIYTIGIEYFDISTGLPLILFIECGKQESVRIIQKLNYCKVMFYKGNENLRL